MLIPLAIYGFLFIGKKFPQTERVASGVSTGQMFKECLRPFFLIFVACMWLTAATELGPGQWIPNILTITTGVAGILILCWINGLMALGRNFAGPIVHRVSPVAVLTGSAFFSAIGLYLLSQAKDGMSAGIAATVFAVGVCFFWPTMLGTVNERFPKTGSVGLAVMGGCGMLSSAIVQPLIGKTYDAGTAAGAGGADKLAALQAAAKAAAADPKAVADLNAAQAAGGQAALHLLVILPVILVVVFGVMFLYDKSRGGYQKEILVQDQENPVTATV